MKRLPTSDKTANGELQWCPICGYALKLVPLPEPHVFCFFCKLEERL